VLIEHPDYYKPERAAPGASVVLGDCADGAGAWTAALRGADAVVHFSAVNPYPNANFDECAGSMAHSFNVFLAARKYGVRRVVLASSNHVPHSRSNLAGPGSGTPHALVCSRD
jgi:nucleoside-diphosphate-sugar epimerase